ncbi:HU family DNA-binding protein, partial [Reyranella sp.]|uniref:HU family DNA-binding protein n=1 Tax=Reyranella sp. TaxID=1929291 RepID=UPI003F6F8B31
MWYSGVDAVFRPPLHLRAAGPPRGSPVNKHDLIAAVAASTNLSKVDAANAVDSILTVITKSLKK